MATTTDTLIFELKVDDKASKVFDSWDKKLQQTGQRAQGVFGEMRTAINSMGPAILTGIVGAVQTSIQAFGTFQQGMREIEKTTGGTTEELDALGEALRKAVITDLSGTTTLSELQKIAAMSAKFGVAKENLASFGVSIAKMAKQWDLSVEKTAEITAKLIAQYDLTAGEVENIGSAIDQVADSFATSEAFVLNFVQRVSGTVKNMGVEMHEVAAIAGSIAENTGMAAEAASGAFIKILATMQTDVSKVSEIIGGSTKEWTELVNNDGVGAFQKLLVELERIKNTEGPQALSSKLQDLFGKNIRVQTLLKGMIGTVDQNAEAMLNAAAAYEEGSRVANNFARSVESQEGGIALMMAGLEDLKITLGDELAPTIEFVTGLINTAVGFWIDVLKDNPIEQFFDEAILFVNDFADAFQIMGKKIDKVMTAMETSLENAWTKMKELVIFGDGPTKSATMTDEGIQNIQGYIGAMTELRVQNMAVFKQNEDLNTLYGTIYKNLANEIDKTIAPSEALQGQFQTLQAELLKVADIAYVNSVFPDLQREILKSEEKQRALNAETTLYTRKISELSNEIGNRRIEMRNLTEEEKEAMRVTIERLELQRIGNREEQLGAKRAIDDTKQRILALNQMVESQKASNLATQEQTAVLVEQRESLSSWTTGFSKVTNTAKSYLDIIKQLSPEAQGVLESMSPEKVLKKLGMEPKPYAMQGDQSFFGQNVIKDWQARQRAGSEREERIQGIEQNLTATINLGGEEIGVITSKINDQNQQNGRRSF